MRRTLAILATLAVAGLTAVTFGGTAGAVGSVNATPSTNIADGTTVTVSWTGLTPFGTPSIVQCKNSPTTGASGADCEFLTLQVAADASNASGAGSDTFVVHDSNGLAAMNARTEVRCDTDHSGSLLVVDNPNDPSSGSFKTITCLGSSTVTPPANVLLSCTGIRQIGALNPALTSGSAKYVKLGAKDSVGDKTEFGGGVVPAETTACAVGTGIRNDDPNTNVGTKLNPYDNQTNSNANLTSDGNPLSKATLGLTGSSSCQTEPQGTVNSTYPRAYPLQGKFSMKFDELTTAGKQYQVAAVVRLSHDIADPDGTHWLMEGTVIKGPGIGGELKATVKMVPTTSVKNLNPLECSDSDVTDDALNASIVEVAITQADGSDQDTAVDPLTVTMPS